MSLEELHVKEEPEWENAGEWGVSEAAALAGLYMDHQVKGEVVLGPEVLQPPDAAYATHVVLNEVQAESCMYNLKPECGDQVEHFNSIIKQRTLVENTIKCEQGLNVNINWHSREDEIVPRKKESHGTFKTLKKTFICDMCNKLFLVRKKIIKHLQIHTEGPHECDICERKLYNRKSLAKHKLLHMERPFHCTTCNKKFAHKSVLIRHKLAHREQKFTSQSLSTRDQRNPEKNTYTCDICDKQYSRINELTCHKRTHVNPIQSKICNKKFATKNGLAHHNVIHSKKRQVFTCEICNKQIKRERNFESHILIHTGEKPFSCEICTKTFRVKEGLKYHMRRIHSNQIRTEHRQNFSCELCDSKFIIKSHLIRHKRIHDDEKPFECKICEKRFRHNKTLSDHMRVHTGERPYACQICGQRFNTNSIMNQHKRRHSPTNKYYCDLCFKGFVQKGKLMRHKCRNRNMTKNRK